jgi:hypothetical protein
MHLEGWRFVCVALIQRPLTLLRVFTDKGKRVPAIQGGSRLGSGQGQGQPFVDRDGWMPRLAFGVIPYRPPVGLPFLRAPILCNPVDFQLPSCARPVRTHIHTHTHTHTYCCLRTNGANNTSRHEDIGTQTRHTPCTYTNTWSALMATGPGRDSGSLRSYVSKSRNKFGKPQGLGCHV